MGIVTQDPRETCNAFQLGVFEIIDEYDYEILDLRYIEELKQLILTINGIVIFVTEDEISISFEINTTPEVVGTLILILTEHINPKQIHITDSFTITLNNEGTKIAVFGSDAKEVYESELVKRKTQYLGVLLSQNVKFYNC